MTTRPPRYAVDIESHYTDPDAVVSPGGAVRYLPTSELRALTIRLTDSETGALVEFHGRRDEDKSLLRWEQGFVLDEIVAKANLYDEMVRTETP